MSRILGEKRNPLPRIGVTDIVILGGLAWFFLSPDTKKVRDFLFPGDTSGSMAIGLPGDPGTTLPGTTLPRTDFRIVLGEWEPALIRLGSTMNVKWTIGHLGPSGTYVVGMEFAPAHLLCRLGMHNPPVTTVEAPLQVGNDAGWQNYTVETSFIYTAPGMPGADLRGYVRDLQGNLKVGGWYCGGIVAI